MAKKLNKEEITPLYTGAIITRFGCGLVLVLFKNGELKISKMLKNEKMDKEAISEAKRKLREVGYLFMCIKEDKDNIIDVYESIHASKIIVKS